MLLTSCHWNWSKWSNHCFQLSIFFSVLIWDYSDRSGTSAVISCMCWSCCMYSSPGFWSCYSWFYSLQLDHTTYAPQILLNLTLQLVFLSSLSSPPVGCLGLFLLQTSSTVTSATEVAVDVGTEWWNLVCALIILFIAIFFFPLLLPQSSK